MPGRFKRKELYRKAIAIKLSMIRGCDLKAVMGLPPSTAVFDYI
jgi:hypothetical protein